MLGYLSSPFKWFFKLEAAGGLVLLISAIIGSKACFTLESSP